MARRRVARPESSKGVGEPTPFEDSGRATRRGQMINKDPIVMPTDTLEPVDLTRETDPLARLCRAVPCHKFDSGPMPLVDREWLVTNGLGGYASGTLCGVGT